VADDSCLISRRSLLRDLRNQSLLAYSQQCTHAVAQWSACRLLATSAARLSQQRPLPSITRCRANEKGHKCGANSTYDHEAIGQQAPHALAQLQLASYCRRYTYSPAECCCLMLLLLPSYYLAGCFDWAALACTPLRTSNG
jgi:hypothetical protein